MTADEYVREVTAVLNAHSERAAGKLNAALACIPSPATRVTIDIHVDQDGEGFLTVRVGMDGPDLYVLNKAIEPHADLFRTTMSANGLEPPLPLMEPDTEEFSVPHVLTDCAANWIRTLWQSNRLTARLPVTINSPEGYGATLPMQLQK